MQDSKIKIPKFKKYSILTSENLQALNINFFNYLDSKYKYKNDGIISGFDIIYDDISEKFIISKGIIKIENEIFYLDSDKILDKPINEGRYYCILTYENIEDDTFNIKNLKFEFKDNMEDEDFILFNIIIRNGAKLSFKNKVFDEYRDEYNTVNLIYQKYLCPYSDFYTLNPTILKKWAQIATSKYRLTNIDLNFVFLCLNTIVSRECIITYINLKLNTKKDYELSNIEILKLLAHILNNILDKNVEIEKNEETYEKFYINS